MTGGMCGGEMCGGGPVWWGHAWQGGMHGGGGGCACHTCPSQHYKIWSVNMRMVRILLECILVILSFYMNQRLE